MVDVDRLDNCACWFEEDQMGSIDSLGVEKGCNIVMLGKFYIGM